MCGRFAVFSSKEALEARFKATVSDETSPHYNAAPSQKLPTILNMNDEEIVNTKWGYLPHWAKPDGKIRPQINARGETVDQKPFFKTSFKSRRCLVLSDGFYEWDRKGPKKIPYFITTKDKEPFAMAGIWDTSQEDGREINTFAIITTGANKTVSQIHDRMPVILQRDEERDWLDQSLPLNAAKEMLTALPDGQIEMFPVSTRVNSIKNDDPELLAKSLDK
ncbi:MAG TPA: SOS response-associated peptidase [Candidatus Paceibacterota bacterium]|nr:SOS response-associated peptidase [Candidatus Paceibacterota bacterium]